MDCILYSLYTSTSKYAQYIQPQHTWLSTKKLFLKEKKLQALDRDSVDNEN